MPEFDLTPDPRVLQMLGEIALDQWKCLAELIDNAIDGFSKLAVHASGGGERQISIGLPTADREDVTITVRDNGVGMDADTLQNAVRAGWSGNSPFGSLGLFGMGFNIATARLGLVTEVWTTRAGDPERTGLRIDLDDLRRTRNYHTPQLTQAKVNPWDHGTEIIIRKLKSEQRQFFGRSANHNKIKKKLREAYAPLLASPSAPIRLEVNGTRITPLRPCHWDPARYVQAPDGSEVHAVEEFNFALNDRITCSHCMAVFSGPADKCPECGATQGLHRLERRVRGWVGIQRYLDESDYGIDLVRNGRVIEVRGKDLFKWTDGEVVFDEYPIDDPRNRGRFIGQIHMDHCRVSYTKDRFERDDPAWPEMVRLVRGEGPLQPQKAAERNYGPNNSPLYRLFQAFRRTSPQGKSGRWSRVLVVQDNERARSMAEEFDKGLAEFQTDEKWWELVLAQDAAIVGGPAGKPSPISPTPPSLPPGFLASPGPNDTVPDKNRSETSGQDVPPYAPPAASRPRRPLLALSRTYEHPLLRFRFNVEAFAVEPDDPDLPRGAPWNFRMDDPATSTYLYLCAATHQAFRSETLTARDGLLIEIAKSIVDFVRQQPSGDATMGQVLSELRQRYAADESLTLTDLTGRARSALSSLAYALLGATSETERAKIFEELPAGERSRLRQKLASAGVADVTAGIRAGTYLSYAEPATMATILKGSPELFFDGRYWEDKYTTVDGGDEQLTSVMRERVVSTYAAYLDDLDWLLSLSQQMFDQADRDRLVRVAQSLRLLRPDSDE
jgi:hypothetical protein